MPVALSLAHNLIRYLPSTTCCGPLNSFWRHISISFSRTSTATGYKRLVFIREATVNRQETLLRPLSPKSRYRDLCQGSSLISPYTVTVCLRLCDCNTSRLYQNSIQCPTVIPWSLSGNSTTPTVSESRISVSESNSELETVSTLKLQIQIFLKLKFEL
jgi:hypothetical protein